MAMVMSEVAFDGHAPAVDQIVEKITQLSGLQLVAKEYDPGIPNLHDHHVHLSFACLPEEQLELYSFLPGSAKKYYEGFMAGFSELPTARYAVGLNEPAGAQVVYLRSHVVDPTLMCVTIVALEALGGKPRDPLTDEERREYAIRISETDLVARRRKAERKLWWSGVVYVLFLPIIIPALFVSILVTLTLMPWRLWKARHIYKQYATRAEHNEFLDCIPNRMTFVEADPEDFPDLDLESLHLYTQRLIDLGFVHQIDYSLRTDVALNNVGFARLFVHPAHHCFAELGQVFPHEGKPSTLRCMIASLLEQEWELGTSDREAIAMSYAWRRPRSLWSCHTELDLTELMHEHLRRRQEMIDRLRIGVKTELSTESYFEHERQTMADRKAALSVKTIETIRAELFQFEESPIYEWLGDLPSDARKQD